MTIQLKQIIKIIKQSKRVAVFAHLSADADCLGSLSAISFLCKTYGKRVDCYIDDDKLKDNYKFMDINVNLGNKFDGKDYDLLISVDIAAERMLGQYKEEFFAHNNTLVIDHHEDRDLLGKYVYVDFGCASCGEIILELIKLSKVQLTKQIATNLYSAIAGDTGCFMHDNTTINTHNAAAYLMGQGADFSTANYYLFKLTNKKTFALKNILNKQICEKEGVTYCIVEQSLLEKGDYDLADISTYVDDLLNIEGTKIAYVIKEKAKNSYSVSLRCQKQYDVAKVAHIFGGGGHKQAAGFSFGGRLKEFEQQLLFEAIKESKRIDEKF